MIHLRAIDPALESLRGQSVGHTLRRNKFSTNQPSSIKDCGYSYIGKGFPTVIEMSSYLNQNCEPDVREAIESSVAYHWLGLRSLFPSEASSPITPSDYVSLFEWDGGDFIDAAIDGPGKKFQTTSATCRSLLETRWLRDQPITFDELVVIRDAVFHNFVWDETTVGELLFVAERDRTFWGRAGSSRLLANIRQDEPISLDYWRGVVEPDSVLAWSVVTSIRYTSVNGKQVRVDDLMRLAEKHSFDEVEPFITAGFTDQAVISGAINSNIDADLLSAVGSVS